MRHIQRESARNNVTEFNRASLVQYGQPHEISRYMTRNNLLSEWR